MRDSDSGIIEGGNMRGKIILTRLQRLRNTDPIFYDHIIEAICEEIEKELKGREDDFSSQDIDYGEGWRDCKHWILSLLKE